MSGYCQAGIGRQGELRRRITEAVAKVDFFNDHKLSIQVKLGNSLQDSLQNLNDIFGAMAFAHKKVVGDLAEREDSFSRNKFYALQVVDSRIGLA